MDHYFYFYNYYLEFKIKDNFLTFKPNEYNVNFFNNYGYIKHLNKINKLFTNSIDIKHTFNFKTALL